MTRYLPSHRFEWTHTINLHGPDGLQMTGMTGDGECVDLPRSAISDPGTAELRSMVKTIDVEKAECYSAKDKLMIQNDIIQHHKTFGRFNDMLKVSWHSVKVYSIILTRLLRQLHLMLKPLSLKLVSLPTTKSVPA